MFFPSHRLAVQTPLFSYTYAELDQQVQTLACYFSSQGLNPGDCVVFCIQDSFKLLLCLLSSFKMGLIAFPINPKLSQFEKSLCMSYSQAKLMMTDLPLLTSFQAFNRSVSCQQLATYLLTSGTTGNPKIAVHTFGQLQSSAICSQSVIPVTTDSLWLLQLPLFHVSGIGIMLRTLSYQGCLLISDQKQSVSDLLSQYPITHLSLVYPQFSDFLSQNMNSSSLKHVLLGGSSFNPALLETAIQRQLPIHFSYGLTEYSSQVATSLVGTFMPLYLLEGVSVRTKDKEIEIKGPSLFQGYLQENGQIHLHLNAEGYFKTGDLGEIELNQLSILGRKDHLFISGGENIYPEEIEAIMMKLPEVKQVVVIPKQHPYFGFRPVGFLQYFKPITEEEMRSFFASFLPKYKIPDSFFPWPIDLKDSGKINRAVFYQYI